MTFKHLNSTRKVVSNQINNTRPYLPLTQHEIPDDNDAGTTNQQSIDLLYKIWHFKGLMNQLNLINDYKCYANS